MNIEMSNISTDVFDETISCIKQTAFQNERKPNVCDLCHEAFYEKELYNQHIKINQFCQNCEKSILSMTYMCNTHVDDDDRKLYQPASHQKGITENNFNDHFCKKNTEELSFVCNICLKSFLNNNILEEHICEIEVNENNSNNFFASDMHVDDDKKKLFESGIHQKEIQEMQFNGDLCENVTEKSSFVCAVCQKLFHNSSTLENHVCLIQDSGIHMNGQKNVLQDAIHQKEIQQNKSDDHNGKSDAKKSSFISVRSDSSNLESHICLVDCDIHIGVDQEKLLEPAVHQNEILVNKSNGHHDKGDTEKSSFVCTDCPEAFSQEADYILHTSVHTNKEVFECNVCIKNFDTKELWAKHVAEHLISHFNKEKTYTVYKKSYTLSPTLNKQNVQHAGEKYLCGVCPKTFLSIFGLRNHHHLHVGKPFMCIICEKLFAVSSDLKLHLKCHTDDKEIKCYICQEICKNIKTFISHLRVHTGEKSFECYACKEGFKSKVEVQDHVLMHINSKKEVEEIEVEESDEERYACDSCNKSYKSHRSLLEHSVRHTGDLFKCNFCEKTFFTKCGLRRHRKLHKELHLLRHIEEEEQLKCSICDRVFKQKSHLRSHLTAHADRPFKCEVCEKKFLSQSYLNRHSYIHINVEPFSCEICKKIFSRKDHVKKHRWFVHRLTN